MSEAAYCVWFFVMGVLVVVLVHLAILLKDELVGDQKPWNWHRGCICEKCGKIYNSPYKAPEYCRCCGQHNGYKSVVVRWRPFHWEVLNEKDEQRTSDLSGV